MKKFLIIFISLILVIPINIYALEPEENKEIDNKRIEVTFRSIENNKISFRNGEEYITVSLKEINIPDEEMVNTMSYISSLLSTSSKIELEYDEQINDIIWVFYDNILLDDTLVSKGYTKAENIYYNSKYMDTLVESEKLAKQAEIGIWKKEEKIEQQEIEKKPVKKNFLNRLLGAIIDFIDGLLEKLLKFIEDML